MTRTPLALPRWVKVGLVYVTALGVGAAAGAALPRSPKATPLGRVGRAFTGEGHAAAADVAAARTSLHAAARQVFDLAVALRGLETGTPDWEQARLACEELDWERCERGALERMAAEVRR